ncbi:MAG: hypothetical protein LUG27_02375 [Clostridiales bacterium]|nr:hypothetical protein [Clostridiales bacterium]
MNHTSQDILREVLLEYMEAEAAQVPQTEELMREHVFSEGFLKKMKLLLAQEEGAGRVAESEGAEKQGGNSAKSGFFRSLSQSRISLRVAAACIVCVVVFGAGWVIYRGADSLTTSDSSATDVATAELEEATEGTEDSAAVSGDTDDADLQSGAGSGSQENDAAQNEGVVVQDGDDTAQDDSGTTQEEDTSTQDEADGADQGGILSTALAETDLAGLSVTVNSYTAYSMELELTNETGAVISYGSYYTIEGYDEDSGTWEAAEQWPDGVFEDLAYIIKEGETVTLTVDWSNLYGELGEGTWRLTKEVQSEDEEFHTLTVVFEL